MFKNMLVYICWCVYVRGQAEKEFKVEVEAIGRVRHKNLVRLLGYCAEGAHRYSDSSLISCYLYNVIHTV